MKKLAKSSRNKVLCGVCGGFADYLNIDPTVVRILWALLSCFFFIGVVAYIVAAIVMPFDNE
ncbi:MAG: PspC domain-containing protein [Oscillospiraceae bacterium]|nr:PspC domain-containing protein [Oscillospiraceae bacterium]